MRQFNRVLFTKGMISTVITVLFLTIGAQARAEMMTCGEIDNSATDTMICTDLAADMTRGTIAFCSASTKECYSTVSALLTSTHLIKQRQLLIAPLEVKSGAGATKERGVLVFCYEAPRYPGDGGYFPCLIQLDEGELSLEAELSTWTDVSLKTR